MSWVPVVRSSATTSTTESYLPVRAIKDSISSYSNRRLANASLPFLELEKVFLPTNSNSNIMQEPLPSQVQILKNEPIGRHLFVCSLVNDSTSLPLSNKRQNKKIFQKMRNSSGSVGLNE
jgi:hypothetical protein